MFIASSSTTVKFHSFPDGDQIYNYQPGSKVDGSIRGISWCKNGSWLSLVPKSGLAEIISVRGQLKLIHTIVDVEEPSCTAFQNTTKKFIAYGTKNGQVLVYDIKSKKIKNRYPRATSLISHVEFTARDTHLVAACLNGDVLLYSNLTQGLSATYRIPRSDSVSALRTNPSKRNLIIGGSNEGVVVVWDSNVNKQKFFIESHKAPVTGVAFSPINSNLIISTGSDRQFCCYDIISHKCIASVPVSSSMTAVDFSHDGTHFVMASQEGNICLYDSRKILEPILRFEAHKSTITNIAFQKQEMINANSSIIEDQSISQPCQENTDDAVTNESLGLFLQAHPEDDDVPDCQVPTSLNHEDSFMVAMGLGNGNSIESVRHTSTSLVLSRNLGEGDYKWDKSATSIHRNETTEHVIPEKLSHYDRLHQKPSSTSTPVGPTNTDCQIGIEMSPIDKGVIRSSEPESQMIPVNEIKAITEEIVKKEMSEMFTSLSHEMKYQFFSSSSQMRRMYLDMQMSNIKAFIKIENNMNALREDLASNWPTSENYLLEENLRLKRQIAILEGQLANKSEHPNGKQ